MSDKASDKKASEHKTSDKLLSCPFCGGEASLLTHKDLKNRMYYYVECSGNNCLIEPFTYYASDKEEVIKLWNTRKPMERVVERLEETKDKDIVFFPPRANNKTAMLGQRIGLDRAIEIVKEEMQ